MHKEGNEQSFMYTINYGCCHGVESVHDENSFVNLYY